MERVRRERAERRQPAPIHGRTHARTDAHTHTHTRTRWDRCGRTTIAKLTVHSSWKSLRKRRIEEGAQRKNRQTTISDSAACFLLPRFLLFLLRPRPSPERSEDDIEMKERNPPTYPLENRRCSLPLAARRPSPAVHYPPNVGFVSN